MGIDRVVEGMGVRAAVPSGGTASSASMAAPARRHAQSSGSNDVLACHRVRCGAASRAATEVIREAFSNRSTRTKRHRVAPGRRWSSPGYYYAVQADPTNPRTGSSAKTRPSRLTCPPQHAMTVVVRGPETRATRPHPNLRRATTNLSYPRVQRATRVLNPKLRALSHPSSGASPVSGFGPPPRAPPTRANSTKRHLGLLHSFSTGQQG